MPTESSRLGGTGGLDKSRSDKEAGVQGRGQLVDEGLDMRKG